METKLRVLQCYVWSTLLYGCECWTISKELETRLKATEMWFLRRILRISWTDMKSNTQVLQMAGIERSLMKTIKRRQLEFLGHILRKDELEKLVLCGKIEGKKSMQRQKTGTTLRQPAWSGPEHEQNRAYASCWWSRRMERHDRRCLFQTWHLKKKKNLI